MMFKSTEYLLVYKFLTMKNYFSADICKGWGNWNDMAEELNFGKVSVGGMQFIYKGCEIDEKKIYISMEVDSMENSKEWLKRQDILKKKLNQEWISNQLLLDF